MVGSEGTPADARAEAGFVIEAIDITRRYGQVQALSGATLRVRRGEVLALVGDNGAGKSTLTKVICGAVRADSGTLIVAGETIADASVRTLQQRGVETVYQDLALAPDLSVAENLFLGREPLRTGLIGGLIEVLDRRRMREAAEAAMAAAGITTIASVDRPVRELSGGQRQAIAVARAVMWAGTAILMDEPTAALGTRQTDIVYDSIHNAAARGLAVVVVSHDIPRMLSLADRLAVMRHGRTVAVTPASELGLTDVVTQMLGGTVQGAAA
jgi:simple sugar transport system ATP-binding protein